MPRTLMSLLFVILAIAGSNPFTRASADDSVALLSDDFAEYRPGVLSSVVGARTEYHYLPEAAARGNWAVSAFRSGAHSQRAWRVVEADGAPAMFQANSNKDADCHPILVAGDDLWSDYTAEIEFTPQRDADQSGIAFRYRNDRCYYFFGVVGPQAVLKMVRHGAGFRKPYEVVLGAEACSWKPGERLTAKVTVEGQAILAELVGKATIGAKDATYPHGKVALVADVPTLYHQVAVTTDVQKKQELDRAIVARRQAESELQGANPKPVVWRKLKTDGFGVGRNLRFGDLNGDGQIDVLIGQVRHHGPKDSNSEISCLTAMNFDGKQLWQIGEPDAWHDHLTNDVAFQIHDIDGDGRNEVVYTSGFKIVIVEGATGNVLREAPTPPRPEKNKPPHNKFPRVLGDSIHFCDLRGTGRDADMVLKDRYANVWAYDDKLQLMWQAQCNTGHYPFAEDVDGDGRDELMVGYTMFDGDGTKLWSLEDRLQDHADGVALVRLQPDAPHRLLCAASDEGMFVADTDGNILKQHYLGHVQNLTTADFRPDLPGLESVTINFWGNQGIVHVFDAAGDIIHEFEPCQHGSMMLPINWTGDEGEYFVLSADVREGGLYDGLGRRVVTFPADGHPDQCNAVLDVTGDCRDEIVVWDPHEIWVYTQDDNPRSGRLYRPTRNPLSNYSNYQATVSLPGWSE